MIFLLVALLLFAPCSGLAQGLIVTVAGSDRLFPSSGPGLAAPLDNPSAVAVDAAGNVYVADFNYNVVARYSRDGTLTLVAGNGVRTGGYSGDGGPATGASLNGPAGIAIDTTGNLYIAEYLSHRIRKVNPQGIITTIAGTGDCCFAGDGGLAVNAVLSTPTGVAVDSRGNVFFSDRDSVRIRKIDPQGMITTVAGTGMSATAGDGGPAAAASLNNPQGIAIDASNNLYVIEQYGHRLRKIDTSGVITTVVGNGTCGNSTGPASTARLCYPQAVGVDASGNLYIADSGNSRIQRVSVGGVVTTIAGGGSTVGDGVPALNSFVAPSGVAADAAGNVLLSDGTNHYLRRVNALGIINTLAGNGHPFYDGDGGPATQALLGGPRHMAFDASGNLYIADVYNNRIRKITTQGVILTVAGTGAGGAAGDGGLATSAAIESPVGVAVGPDNSLYIAQPNYGAVRRVNPNGIISTFAGGGSTEGDNILATSARLRNPNGVAVDAAGNVFISDYDDHRIRKVNAAGVITTVAGTGVSGFSGDNGPATAAQINGPSAVVVDGSGTLYIVEYAGLRIRKVTNGIISTIAGTGQSGSSGDGGQARNATFQSPEALALDTAGNIYVAERDGQRVRKIDTRGVISIFAGGLQAGFSGDGGLATTAALNEPWGLAVDTTGNIYIAERGNNRVRAVLTRKSTFAVTPTSLVFTSSGGSTPSQRLALNGDPVGLLWLTDSVLVEPGVPSWLTVTPNSGPMPASVDVSANAANLSPGTYKGTIVIAALGTTSTVTISVTLTVTSGSATPSVTPASLSFLALVGGSAPPAQTLRIDNTSGSFSTKVTAIGGSWLSIAPASANASGSGPALPQVTANPAGLAAGTYSGNIAVTAGGQTFNIPVTLRVSVPSAQLLLSQTGLLYRAVEAGGADPSQTFGVLATGSGGLDWTADTTAAWLTIAPVSGHSDAGTTQIPLVTVSVDPTGLKAGYYSGLVRVTSAGASNSPQVVRVDLQVLAPGSRLPAVVRPTGLIFAATAGGGAPGSQEVQVATAQSTTLSFLSQPIGGTWVTRTPDLGTAVRGTPGRIVVKANPAGLASGVYRAGITVFTTDDGEQYPVRLLFLVLPGGTSASSVDAPPAPCNVTQLYLQFSTQFSSFASAVGYPSNLSVLARDSCGNPATGALVTASFSNGDPSLALIDMKNGLYEASWRPTAPSSAPITVNVRGSLAGVTGETQATVSLSSNPNTQAALLSQGGVLPAAGFERGPLAPGSIVALFGQNFVAAAASAPSVPLPQTLGGLRVTVGGKTAPLYYAGPNQVNVQVPVELAADQQLQVLVEANGVSSAPEPVQTVAARPGIFTLGGQFGAQGAILLAGTDRLAMPSTSGISSAPVKAGDILSIYCSGLGAVDPPVPSGQASTGVPLSFVKTNPTVTIGGQPATVSFAGLAPGLVGVYQINVTVPAGVAAGNAVSVQIIQGGFSSNTATIAVQ